MLSNVQNVSSNTPSRLLALALCGLIAAGLSCGDESKPADAGVKRPDKVNYIIVAADVLTVSAGRYKSFRDKTGYNVALALVKDLAPKGSSNAVIITKIQAFIKKHYDARDKTIPFFVLLIGDANKLVPTGNYWEAYNKTNSTSDNIYADFDGDNIPDLAIGRIPASSDLEVERFRAKVEKYEATYTVGMWNRRVNLFASSGNFDALTDMLIEKLALIIVDAMSYSYDISMTYGNQKSEFVYVPEQFSDKVYERLNEGSMLSAYIGHGLTGTLDDLEWNGKKYPIMDVKQLEKKLKVKNKLPLFVIIACLTGAFDDSDALAERVLRMEDAPPAVIASTEVSHPYTNSTLVLELGHLATEHKQKTVGALFQWAKYRMVRQKDPFRDQLRALGQTMLQPGEMAALDRTHLHMYTLFGDPGMKLRYVQGKAKVTVSPAEVKRGGKLTATADLGALSSGSARFSLESSRTIPLSGKKAVPADGASDRDAVIKSNYAAANDRVVDSKDVTLGSSKATVTFTLPTKLPLGEYYVKVYAEDGTQDAVGHQKLKVVQ